MAVDEIELHVSNNLLSSLASLAHRRKLGLTGGEGVEQFGHILSGVSNELCVSALGHVPKAVHGWVTLNDDLTAGSALWHLSDNVGNIPTPGAGRRRVNPRSDLCHPFRRHDSSCAIDCWLSTWPRLTVSP